MSERGQTGGRAKARNDAESTGRMLPRRDPGQAGRSRARIPTRFSRENPPAPADPDGAPRLPGAARQGAAQRPALEAAPYAIRPGAPVLPAQPSTPASGDTAAPAAFSVRPGGPEAPADQPADGEGAIVGVLVDTGAGAEAAPDTTGAAEAAPRPQARQDAAPPRRPDGRRPDGEGRSAGPARARSRRRRRLLRTVLVAAALAAGGGLLAATLGTSGGSRPSASRSGPAAAAAPSAGASAPPAAGSASAGASAPDPLRFLDQAATDTAPLTVQALFPGRTIRVHGHSYTRVLTDATPHCANDAAPPLDAVLRGNGCRAVFRATYTAGGTAVTVGIAVFDTSTQAAAAERQATKGNLESLFGGRTPKFCRAVACRLTGNAAGRYAYFTVAGYLSGKPVPPSDTSALAAGTDASDAAFQILSARARAAAARAAGSGAAAAGTGSAGTPTAPAGD